MKKLFALLLALMMVLSLAACGGGGDEKTSSNEDKTPSSSQQQEQNTPDPAPAPDNPDSSKDENSGEDEQKDVPVPTTGLPLNWPDNDHTRLVPAPDCGGKVLSSGDIGTLFAIELKWDMEQGLSYARLLAEAGFGEDCAEKYEKQGYIDRTAGGVNVQLLDCFGTASLSIMPVEEEAGEDGGAGLSAFLNTKIGKFYSRFASGEMSMEYKTVVEGMEMRIVTASKDGKSISESFIDGVSGGVNIVDGETMYTVMHEQKMVMKMPLRTDMQGMTAEIIREEDVDVSAIVEGTREVNGRTYDTEELTIDGAKAVYCFEGDELRFMLSEMDGVEVTMEIVEVSDKVDPDLFEIPEDYTVMEM